MGAIVRFASVWARLIVAALILVAGPAFAQQSQATLDGSKKAVVRVVVLWAYAGEPIAVARGSGFGVGGDRIVTNLHVVGIPEEWSRIQHDPKLLQRVIYVVPDKDVGAEGDTAEIYAVEKVADLALLRTKTLKVPALPIASVTPDETATVYALGYPGATDRLLNRSLSDIIIPAKPYVTPGSVALKSNSSLHGRVFEAVFHTAAINGGNSGGPLVDECGRVIGINTLKSAEQATEGQSVAVSSAVLLRWLQANGMQIKGDETACHVYAPLDPRITASITDLTREVARNGNALAQQGGLLIWALGASALGVVLSTIALLILVAPKVRLRATPAPGHGLATAGALAVLVVSVAGGGWFAADLVGLRPAFASTSEPAPQLACRPAGEASPVVAALQSRPLGEVAGACVDVAFRSDPETREAVALDDGAVVRVTRDATGRQLATRRYAVSAYDYARLEDLQGKACAPLAGSKIAQPILQQAYAAQPVGHERFTCAPAETLKQAAR